LRGDADAVVFDPKNHVAILKLRADTDQGAFANGNELYRIAQKIRDALSEGGYVAKNPGKWTLDLEVHVFGAQLRIGLDDISNELIEIHRDESQLGTNDSSIGQDVADEGVHASCRSHNSAEVLEMVRSE